MDTTEPGLAACGIVKRFAGVPALAGVSITVRPGEVVGLVGHNGAGKSTLLKVLAGVHRADEGTVFVDGKAVSFTCPAAALNCQVATVYQELSLLPNLTVTQNIFLGHEHTSSGILRRAAMRQEACELVESFALDVDVTRPLGYYPVATRQLLEIAVAIHRQARYLLLDEPTTSLEGEQVDRLLARIGELACQRNIGVLLVNHKLDELYAVSQHVVALVDGKVRIDANVATVSRDEVVRAIVGDDDGDGLATDDLAPLPLSPAAAGNAAAGEVGNTYAGAAKNATDTAGVQGSPIRSEAACIAPSHASASTTLEVRNLRTSVLNDVSVMARSGQVLGIYGLIGSGRTEFLRTLVGLDQVLGGEISVLAKPYKPKNPAQAQDAGLVYLTEERKSDGIVGGLDSVTNVVLPILRNFTRLGVLDVRAMRKTAHSYLEQLRVIGNRNAPTVRLSGGNQQKVLIARALAQQPQVLLLDEPTKGVDIGVKAEIHRIMRALAHERGLTVVFVSSEEEEILEAADDVLVFVGGCCDGASVSASQLTAAELRRRAWSGV